MTLLPSETLLPGHPVTTQEYADMISAEWRKSVDGIFEMARYLTAAKESLPHGEFLRMFPDHDDPVERPVPFRSKAGVMIRQIGSSETLSNGHFSDHLPPAWRTLYELREATTDQLAGWIENGELSPETTQQQARKLMGRHKAQLDAAARQIDPPENIERHDGDGWTVYNGDFRDVLGRAEFADSIDAIMTDPPYPHEFLPLFSDLSRLGGQVLVEQGMVICLSGKMALDRVMERLGEYLSFGWMYATTLPGSNTRIGTRQVAQEWKPWLVYTRGAWPSGRIPWHGDLLTRQKAKSDYHWQQGIEDAIELIERLTVPDAVIVDPMMGVGTYGEAAIRTGRRFIGIEMDRERYQQSISRLEAIR